MWEKYKKIDLDLIKEELNTIYAENFYDPKVLETKLRIAQSESLKNIHPDYKQEVAHNTTSVISEFMKRSLVEHSRRVYRSTVNDLKDELADIFDQDHSTHNSSQENLEYYSRLEDNLEKQHKLQVIGDLGIQGIRERIDGLKNIHYIIAHLDKRNLNGELEGDIEDFRIVAHALRGFNDERTNGHMIDIEEDYCLRSSIYS